MIGEQGYDMVSIWMMSSERTNCLLEPVVSFHTAYVHNEEARGARTISQEDGILYVDLHGLCKLNCLTLESRLGIDLAEDVPFLYSSLPTSEDMMCHCVIFLFNQS